MDFTQKKILVAGLGASGIGAASLLMKKGAKVLLFDENVQTNKEELIKKLEGAEFFFGILPPEKKAEVELAVFSPGVPTDTPFADSLRKSGIQLIGEIELAWLCGCGTVAAITGTNGKTTTTALLGKIAKEYFESSFIVGNIGRPYTEEVLNMQKNSVIVAEVSSFQLETIDSFHPRVSAILNLTQDHLDRHHTMENYGAAKARIFQNQNQEDTCVLNYEDTYCRELAFRCPAKVVYFSSQRSLEEGYYLEEGVVWHAVGGKREKLFSVDEVKLLGDHNMENIMAAIAMAEALKVPRERIIQSVRTFSAVEHRIEYVTTIDGIDYYNDSKGTNPDAAIKAVKAMNRPTVLIGGGYDKKGEFDEWIDSFGDKITWLILLGQTREKIAACAQKKGFERILFADSLEEAVKLAASKARGRQAVLLSPACASWGMFPNYEVRGRLFKEYVWKLKES